jgi:UPF0755 protein
VPGGGRDGSSRGSSARSPHRHAFRPRRWALLLLLIAATLVFADLFVPAGLFPAKERRVVLVQRGQSLREVARELERVGLLRGTLGFEVLARFMHLDRSIKAGQYSFRLGVTVPELLHAFARGMSGLNLITFPEGLTTSEIAVLLSNRLGVPIAAFDSLAHDRVFLDSLSIAAPSIEGYLAPDSYEFLPGTSPEVAFRTMVQHQREVLLKLSAGRDSLPLGMSLHEVLTLASIVESEAQIKDERARIASVYLNRLEKHMRLQADPTVGYALGIGPRSRLYLRQLRFNSPFNTYLHGRRPAARADLQSRPRQHRRRARSHARHSRSLFRGARRRPASVRRDLRAAPAEHRESARHDRRRRNGRRRERRGDRGLRRAARRQHDRQRQAAIAAHDRAGHEGHGQEGQAHEGRRGRHHAQVDARGEDQGRRGRHHAQVDACAGGHYAASRAREACARGFIGGAARSLRPSGALSSVLTLMSAWLRTL